MANFHKKLVNFSRKLKLFNTAVIYKLEINCLITQQKIIAMNPFKSHKNYESFQPISLLAGFIGTWNSSCDYLRLTGLGFHKLR